MSESFPNFCGGTYQVSSVIDEEDLMNGYLEKADSPGSRTPIAILRTPGKKTFAQLEDEIAVPGLFIVNGRRFAAASNLWELTPSGPVNRGSLGSVPVTPTQILANETQLVVLNNGNLFILTFATNVFSAVDMTQFNGPVAQIVFVDGYVIATLQNSHTFQQSNLEDASTWSGLNIATISYFPDNIVSMIADRRIIWFWSGKQAIGYYNAGAGFPVFIPIQGAFLQSGSGAAFATSLLDNSVYWLDQDDRGNMIARKLVGISGSQRVSTHATELAWQSYAKTSDAVSYSYQEDGHTFWQIFFPSANNGNGATWDYDVATGYWHRRGAWSQDSGTYIADRSMCHLADGDLHLVGDPFSGKVYQQSLSFYSDDGAIIRGFRRSPTLNNENKWGYFEQIEFDMETGVSPEVTLIGDDGLPRNPQVMLRWSNDGGKTWPTNTYFLSLGQPGTTKRVIKRMLGRSRKRVWELAWSDPIAIKIADAYLRMEWADA